MSSGADGQKIIVECVLSLSIYRASKLITAMFPPHFFSLSLHFIPPLLLDALAQFFRRISSDESSSTS